MLKKSTKLEQLSDKIYITVEEMRNLGIENLNQMFLKIYLEQVCQLTDSRHQKKVKHPLKDIVGIVFFVVPVGNDKWTKTADCAVDEKEILQKYLELPKGIPSHDTIQRVFFILHSDELQNMLVDILVQLVNVAKNREGLDEYLYRNDEFGCYIRHIIIVDGKGNHNTGKKQHNFG